MRELSRIKAALFNTPWAISELGMETILGVLETAINDPEAAVRSEFKSEKPQLQIMDGVPIIPIDGPISKRMNLMSRMSGGTSIELLNRQFSEALAMAAPAIIFHIDSPGGGVNGVAEFGTRIWEEAQTGGTTIVSLADGVSASAAIWLGSQCNECYATEGSVVGSIGVIARIVDYSRMDKNAGIDEEIFRSSDLKGVGAGPLQNNHRSKIIRDVAIYTSMFKEAIARARPDFDFEAVDPADTWIGKDAQAIGLVDGITTLDRLVARYASR